MINKVMNSPVDTIWLLPKAFDNLKAYTLKEISEVRKLWADFYMKIRPVGNI